MKYPRPAFGDPSVKTTTTKPLFGASASTLPVFDTPISAKDNFFRAAHRDKPMWVPLGGAEIQSMSFNELADARLGKDGKPIQLAPDFVRMYKENYTFLDFMGNSWSWVAEADGAMLTPGTKLLDDICDWEKVIDFDVLKDWNFKAAADKFLKTVYDPNKVLNIDLHQGLTEMLVAFLGGYGEGMLALAEEPEACGDFFNRYADFMIELFDLVSGVYPVDFITYHDDWGSEKDTFFSEKMMEELVFEPTKRIIDHIKGSGKVFELHCCGRIERFVPYMCDLNIDFLQIQRRANDMPKLKELYGDRIGFNAPVEDFDPTVKYSEDELRALIRRAVDTYGAGGGMYPMIFGLDEKDIWTAFTELYAYSREFYDRENNR